MSRKTRPIRSADDLAHYLTAYPEEITFGDRPADEVFDGYHAEDFVLVNDGLALDRQRLLDHVQSARKRARAVAVDVRDVLMDGDRVAARYALTADLRKGNRIVTEIHFFGQLAPDGRLRRVEQLTRTP